MDKLSNVIKTITTKSKIFYGKIFKLRTPLGTLNIAKKEDICSEEINIVTLTMEIWYQPFVRI